MKQNSFTFTYKNMKLVFRGIKNGYRHETICFMKKNGHFKVDKAEMAK